MLNTSEKIFDGCYVPTNNQMGFMLTKVDPFIQRFVDYTAQDLKNWHLDVGAAFGIATVAALERGAKIVANDLDENHLKVISDRCKLKFNNHLQFSLGDIKEEIEYPSGFFGSILFSRVLHFFTGEDIIACLKKVSDWLVCEGKIFIVSETPYFGTCKDFLPIYLQRKHEKEKWPGYMELAEAKKYFDPSKRPFVTSSVHLFDEDLIEYVAQKAGLNIEEMGTLNRHGFFPEDALYDGRESLWVVLTKNLNT